jgi:hypothetical protein
MKSGVADMFMHFRIHQIYHKYAPVFVSYAS